MRFAASVAFPRFFWYILRSPTQRSSFFYMRGARYAAPLIRRMTGVCAGRTAFLCEKRRILHFRQTPFSAYGIFLQNPANFPFRFFSYGKRGIRIKKATRRARDVTPARFAPDRPPVGVVRAPPRQAAAIATLRTTRFSPCGPDTSRRTINKRAPFKDNPSAEKRTD